MAAGARREALGPGESLPERITSRPTSTLRPLRPTAPANECTAFVLRTECDPMKAILALVELIPVRGRLLPHGTAFAIAARREPSRSSCESRPGGEVSVPRIT